MERFRTPERVVLFLVGLIILVTMAGAFLLLPASGHLRAHFWKIVLITAVYIFILYTITRHPGARRLRYLISTLAVLTATVLCYDFHEDLPAICLLHLFPIATAVLFWDMATAIFTAALSTLGHAAAIALTAPLTANRVWDMGFEGALFFLMAILAGIGVEEWRLRTEQLAVLNAVAQTLSQSLDLDTVLSVALNKVLETLQFESGVIYVKDSVTGELEMRQYRGLSEEFRRAVAKGIISARVAESGKPVVIDDLSRDPKAPRVAVEEEYRPLASIPLLSKGEVQGVLTIASRQLRRFRQQDVDLLLSIGNQIGVAIENARLYEEEQERRQEAETLRQAAQALSATLNLQEVFQSILSELQKVVPYDSASVQLLRGDRLEIIGGHGFPNLEELLGVSFPLNSDNPNRQVVASRAPFIVKDAPAVYSNFRQEPHAQAGIRAWLGVPLLFGDRLIGMIALDKKVPGFYTEEHAHLALAFTAQAAIAIENARLFNQAQQRIAELATFNEIGRAIASTMKLDELWELIYHQTCRVMEVSAFYIALYDREKEKVNVVIDILHGQRQPQEEGPRDLQQGRNEYIIRTKKPLLIRGEVQETYDRLGIVSSDKRAKGFAGVPITTGGEVIGVLAVQNYERDDAYDEHTIELLSTIANQAAIAIENAHLYEETQKRLAETTALHKVAEIINASLDLKEIFQRVVEELSKTFGYRLVDIYLLEEKTLRLQASVGLDAETTIESIPLERGVLGRVARTGQPAFIRDVSQDPDYIGSHPDITCEICVPIKSGETLLGILNVESDGTRPLTEDDLQLLLTLSSHIGVAIENARLYDKAQGHLKAMTTLQRIGMEITASLDLSTLLQGIADSTLELTNADYVHLFALDPDTGEFNQRAASWWPEAKRPPITWPRRNKGLTAAVLKAQEPVIIERATDHPLYSSPESRKWGVKSVAGFPLKGKWGVTGVLNVVFLQPHAFSKDELQLLALLADQGAIAIENARLYEEEQRRSTQRHTIAEVGRRGASILEMDALLSQVVDLIAQNFGYYHVHVFQIDPDSDCAIYKAGTGKVGLAIAEEGLRLKVGEEGIIGWVAQHGQPLLVNDVGQEPRYYPHPALPDTRSELSVPIRAGGRIIGVLDVQSTELNAFDESDLDTLQTLADQLAVAMENARLYEETQRLAITDGLTGLYNLRYFYETLEREIQRSERYHRSVSLIMLDIDGFKAYNDLYGHLAGDALLIELAQLMSKVTRRTDTLARYGGEEFAIILPETETEGARFLAERLLEEVRKHRFSMQDSQTIGRITISLGVATYPHHADSAKTLVHAADKALLRAKQAGKNRLSVCGEELTEPEPR